jgi:hypothetical protein
MLKKETNKKGAQSKAIEKDEASQPKRTTEERMQKLQASAKADVARRGDVKFKLGKRQMRSLMKISDAQKTPLGVLSRQWLMERLDAEEKALANQAGGEELKQ